MGTFLKRHHWVTPLALLTPGILWLLIFYLYPAVQMFLASFWSGSLEKGYDFSFSNWTNYTKAVGQYWPFYVRSIVYAAAATTTTFLIAYPLAYTIAFKGGRFKNLLLFLVVAPFFTSFLLRTISWEIILGDNGPILGPLKSIGILPSEFRILATPMAVIAGITYNFLPFMTLPLCASMPRPALSARVPCAAVAEYAPQTIGLTLEEGKRLLAAASVDTCHTAFTLRNRGRFGASRRWPSARFCCRLSAPARARRLYPPPGQPRNCGTRTWPCCTCNWIWRRPQR